MANNATLTCTAYAEGPITSNHGAAVTVSFYKNSGATKYGTAGDTILLAKIPTGALLVDAAIYAASTDLNVSDLVIWNGDGTSGTTTLITSLSVADGGTNRATLDVPAYTRISMSDDNAIRYATLALRNTSGSETTSFVVSGWVQYITGRR